MIRISTYIIKSYDGDKVLYAYEITCTLRHKLIGLKKKTEITETKLKHLNRYQLFNKISSSSDLIFVINWFLSGEPTNSHRVLCHTHLKTKKNGTTIDSGPYITNDRIGENKKYNTNLTHTEEHS